MFVDFLVFCLRSYNRVSQIFDFENTENDPENVNQIFLRVNMNGQREKDFVVNWGFRS